ncbi:MAG: hypothetical protein V1656_00075 [Candidatus Jorgensenbacteria bacterium]
MPRPYIPVYLIGKTKSTPSPYYALLDSGADKVLMPADLAQEVWIMVACALLVWYNSGVL